MTLFRFLSVAALTLSLLIGTRSAMAQQAATFTPAQKAAIEGMIRDYLLKNPEVLVDAMHALDAKQQAGAAEAARAAVAANRKEIFEDGVSFVAGNPKGDVTIVEFFDYRCPYCKQMQPHIQALLKEDGKLRLVLKELPVLGPESVTASRAAIAAMEQGKGDKYIAFHDAMMAFRGQLSEDEVYRMAGKAGLDVKKLKTDMQAPKIEAVLRDNLALADKLGLQGTPAFVIGEELVPGAVSLDSLRQLVQAARS
jgi:protein-disulfide isomerase